MSEVIDTCLAYMQKSKKVRKGRKEGKTENKKELFCIFYEGDIKEIQNRIWPGEHTRACNEKLAFIITGYKSNCPFSLIIQRRAKGKGQNTNDFRFICLLGC
jgi:hypothetical protein